MYKIIAISLIALHFVFRLFINVVDYKSRNRRIPTELEGVFDEERYLKWKRYKADIVRVDIIESCVSFALILGLLLGNVFSLAAANIENPYVATIAVLGIYIGASTVFDIPFAYYNSIVIEGRYGFNNSSVKTFVVDQIKKLIIEVALFLGLTCLFQLIHTSLGDWTLLLFSGILLVFMLGLSFLYPVLSKVFNKFTPLEEGELRTALIAMLEKHNYKVRDIKVMDASRRTTKSNAYFTGFGKSKTIVLYDNLLKVMDNEQILGIFAHEMGHGLHKDTLKNSIASIVQIAILVTLAWLMVRYPQIYADFGFGAVNYGLAVILFFSSVMPFVSLLLGLFTSRMSRRAEYRADEQAFKEGYADALISGLKVLFREDLGDLNPHPLVVALYYSHPTLLQRVQHIEKLKNEKE